MTGESAAPADPMLAAYLAAADETRARDLLGDLLAGTAAPLVWRVLRRQLGGRGGGVAEADLEDLHGATLLRLQLQLAALRQGEREPMASFPNYVAVTAFNAAASFLMAREPERTRLRHRVRYVLRKNARLALWSAPGQELICGLAAWRDRPAVEGSRRLADLAAAEVASGGGARDARLPAVTLAVLEGHGGPCRFEELVDALAPALGVRDDPHETLPESVGEPDRGHEPEPVDGAPTALSALESRQALARLWAEIRELPPLQRAALLLNLRDESGGDMLEALLASGLTDRGELAADLGLAEVELGELLPRLPLEDLRIADRLGLSRQQVINLRKSARLRLGRRMRGAFPGVGGMGG